MLMASIAHFYVFPHYEWEPGYVREEKSKTKFGDNLALRDFIGDLKIIMGGNKKRGRKEGQGGENWQASALVLSFTRRLSATTARHL